MTGNYHTSDLKTSHSGTILHDYLDFGVDRCRLVWDWWGHHDQAVQSETEEALNRELACYPHNHNYRIVNRQLVPGWRLFARVNRVRRFYPNPLRSLLDLSSCKGYYVLDAAFRHPQCRAVGIDVHAPFIQMSNQVSRYAGFANASFYQTTIDQLLDRGGPDAQPYQVVLFLGSYHYFFWGSHVSDVAYYDHQAILSRLARLNSERLIFSGRLEIERLPGYLRERAQSHPAGNAYNTPAFLAAAAEYYDVTPCGSLGRDELYLMTRK